MDQPVTDVVFVSSPDLCPEGYKIILKTPCGHEANLWEKFIGGKSAERYLCFTKTEKKDGMVVEDLYFPGRSEHELLVGYHTIKYTTDDDDALNERYLAMKRSPKKSATHAVYDIGVFRSKDKPAKCFKQLSVKINGNYIYIRRSTYTPASARKSHTISHPPSGTSKQSVDVSELSQSVGKLDIDSHAARPVPAPRSSRGTGSLKFPPTAVPVAEVVTIEDTCIVNAPPPPTSYEQDTSPLTHGESLQQPTSESVPSYPPSSTQQPSPPPTQGFEQQRMTGSVSSYPPTSAGNTSGYPPPPSSAPGYPASGSNAYSSPSLSTSFDNSNYPPAPPATSSGYPGTKTYPPQQPANSMYPGAGGYPPPASSSAPGYPSNTGYPSAPSSAGYSQPAGYPPPPPPSSSMYSGGGGYPPAPQASVPPYGYGAPPGGPPLGGYNAAGSGFVGAPINNSNSGPAPYNPYQHNQPYQDQTRPGQYPPPPAANNSPSYGFRF